MPVMLLHNYPFHRHAGYLAQVFDHVFVDVGLAMQNVGSAGARRVLGELLELAPFSSVLFSTDAFGLAELYLTSTMVFRRALSAVLDEGIRADAWTAADAERIAYLVGAGQRTPGVSVVSRWERVDAALQKEIPAAVELRHRLHADPHVSGSEHPTTRPSSTRSAGARARRSPTRAG